MENIALQNPYLRANLRLGLENLIEIRARVSLKHVHEGYR